MAEGFREWKEKLSETEVVLVLVFVGLITGNLQKIAGSIKLFSAN